MPWRHSTQFVLGASDETDLELFSAVAGAYEKYHPARIYYSAFHAIEGTALEKHPDTPLWRAGRWYQMDALFRLYGYSRSEAASAFDEQGMLPNMDPKVLLAEHLPAVNPDTASREELLRVPGIGVAGAEALLSLRKTQSVRDTGVLRACGIILSRALPYLSLGKTRQTTWKMWCPAVKR
jgi:predicted DNA-binding helix-hairpin-helix protein